MPIQRYELVLTSRDPAKPLEADHFIAALPQAIWGRFSVEDETLRLDGDDPLFEMAVSAVIELRRRRPELRLTVSKTTRIPPEEIGASHAVVLAASGQAPLDLDLVRATTVTCAACDQAQRRQAGRAVADLIYWSGDDLACDASESVILGTRRFAEALERAGAASAVRTFPVHHRTPLLAERPDVLQLVALHDLGPILHPDGSRAFRTCEACGQTLRALEPPVGVREAGTPLRAEADAFVERLPLAYDASRAKAAPIAVHRENMRTNVIVVSFDVWRVLRDAGVTGIAGAEGALLVDAKEPIGAGRSHHAARFDVELIDASGTSAQPDQIVLGRGPARVESTDGSDRLPLPTEAAAQPPAPLPWELPEAQWFDFLKRELARRGNPYCHVVGHCLDEEEVQDVEREIGAKLPRTYRAFLRRWSFAGFFGDELGRYTPRELTIERPFRLREVSPRQRPELIAFALTARGDAFAFDASRPEPGDEMRILFCDGESDTADGHYTSFLRWLYDVFRDIQLRFRLSADNQAVLDRYGDQVEQDTFAICDRLPRGHSLIPRGDFD